MDSRKLPGLLLTLATVAATACGSGSGGSDDGTGTGTGSDGSGAGDDGGDGSSGGTGDGSDTGDDLDETPPVISGVTLTPNPKNHLSATIEFETDEPATASVVVDNGDGHGYTVVSPQGAVTTHVIDVLGFRAEQSYAFEVEVEDGAGNTAVDDSLTYDTDPLPDDFPVTMTAASEPSKMAPGFTVLNVGRWSPLGPDALWGILIALDAEGHIVWYHREAGAHDIRRQPNGNLLFISGEADIREIDMMGREVAGWSASTLSPPADSVHHEAFPMADDTILTLGSELRSIAGYPDPMGGTATYDVVGDVVIQFARDATVVDSWSLLDVLEPYQHRITIREDFDSPYWNQTYMDVAPDGTKDWSHGNAVVYDEDADLFLISARHLDWIVAIERATGDLAWRLGPDGDFTLDGDSWAYHPHAPELQDDGSVLIYDNGNGRPGTGFEPGDDPPYSRAVEYALDTTTWTATETWAYVHPVANNYAPFVGDADRLSNGNVLITDGGLVSDPAANIFEPTNIKSARILEVTADDPAEVVFELEIGDLVTGYTTYRADRIESLQP